MNDQESRFAHKVTAHLDWGTAKLRSGTVYRLQQARAAALAGVNHARTTGTELATAGAGGTIGRSGMRGTPARWLAAVMLVAAMGFGYHQWHAMQQVREFEELACTFSRRTCRSTPIWTGDSRIGFGRRSTIDEGFVPARAGRIDRAWADHAEVAGVERARRA